MRGERSTWFVVSLALIASLVCHVAIQRHFDRKSRSALAESEHASAEPSRFHPRLELSEFGGSTIPRFLDDGRPEGFIIPAVEVQDDDSYERNVATSEPPTAVPAPVDAVPVETPSVDSLQRNAELDAVRDVIEQELSHATPEEREIWFDELKSLPAGVVLDLLQVRKQVRALPRLLGGMPDKLVSADPAMVPHRQEITAERASQKIRFGFSEHSSTSVLELALSQLRHNLTNAATPGYKRLRVTLVDAYSLSSQELAEQDSQSESVSCWGKGCRIAPMLLDLKQGPLKKTSRQLDLAIDGEGFFVVRRGEKEFLTRCGAFILDRDRQLCLAVTNDNAVVQPALTVPDEAKEIQISADGTVTMLKSGGTKLSVIGQLQLVRVPSPARLQPIGDALLQANGDSGEVVFGAPMANGFGEIQQGCLEQSNVDFERELDEIEQLTTILNALPLPNARPATARNHQQAPTR